MFGLFKKRKWQQATLEKLRGNFQGLSVSLSNVPCRIDDISGVLSYPYPDFGAEFIGEFHRQIGAFEQVQEQLASHTTIMAIVSLRDYKPINVELCGTPPKSRQQYDSDVADAILAAFNEKGLKP